MAPSKPGWIRLQQLEGPDFLQWLRESQTLPTRFSALTEALYDLLVDRVRTRKDALDLWASVPAVMSRCNCPGTYCMPRADLAYAWLHLPDRYIRTWIALERLVENCLLPMGTQGVRALDVGTGPGPSAFATHDFFAAMTRYAEESGNRRWRQPPQLSCSESSVAMNGFRHHLAEALVVRGAPSTVLAMCGSDGDFESIHPAQERKLLYQSLRHEEDSYYDDHSQQWREEQIYSSAEASQIANQHRRYRLFTFSNFFTTKSVIDGFECHLGNILSDARPGSVLLVVGASGNDYPVIHSQISELASEAGFFLNTRSLPVSSTAAGMKQAVFSEGTRFYKRLKYLAGDLSDNDLDAKNVKTHFERATPGNSPTSYVYAYRKL